MFIGCQSSVFGPASLHNDSTGGQSYYRQLRRGRGVQGPCKRRGTCLVLRAYSFHHRARIVPRMPWHSATCPHRVWLVQPDRSHHLQRPFAGELRWGNEQDEQVDIFKGYASLERRLMASVFPHAHLCSHSPHIPCNRAYLHGTRRRRGVRKRCGRTCGRRCGRRHLNMSLLISLLLIVSFVIINSIFGYYLQHR